MPHKGKNYRYCPLFGKCGGCEYINEAYRDELSYKKMLSRKIFDTFSPVLPIIGADKILGYRVKVKAFCSYDREGKFTTGIYMKGTHRVLSVRKCDLENGKATAILKTVR